MSFLDEMLKRFGIVGEEKEALLDDVWKSWQASMKRARSGRDTAVNAFADELRLGPWSSDEERNSALEGLSGEVDQKEFARRVLVKVHTRIVRALYDTEEFAERVLRESGAEAAGRQAGMTCKEQAQRAGNDWPLKAGAEIGKETLRELTQ
jgi:hypothetical protein